MANNIITQLKSAAADPSSEDLDALIHLRAQGSILKGSYAEFEMEAPDWLTTALDAIGRAIRAQRSDAIAAELKRAEAQLEALKTAEEKRGDLRSKIERLKTAASKT